MMTQKQLECCNRIFECKLKSKYKVESQNCITCIHYNKVNHIAECNSLHDIFNPPKRTQKSLHSFNIYGYINTRKGKVKFKKFCILLGSEYISAVVMVWLVQRLGPKKGAVMQ